MPDKEKTKENIPERIAELAQIINDTKEVVNQYPPEVREQLLFDQWSLKDILAHFSGWNWLTIRDLARLKSGETIDEWIHTDEQLNEFNRIEVEQRKNRPWDEIYTEFVDSCDQLLLAYKGLSAVQWEAQFGPDADSTPKRSLLIDIEHMGDIHLPELKNVIAEISQQS
jgi:hypothetical protein